MKTTRIGSSARTMLNHLAVHGPTSRKELLALVAPTPSLTSYGALYGLNWGNSYFSTQVHDSQGRGSLVVRGLIQYMGKGPRNTKIFAITPKGLEALSAS